MKMMISLLRGKTLPRKITDLTGIQAKLMSTKRTLKLPRNRSRYMLRKKNKRIKRRQRKRQRPLNPKRGY